MANYTKRTQKRKTLKKKFKPLQMERGSRSKVDKATKRERRAITSIANKICELINKHILHPGVVTGYCLH